VATVVAAILVAALVAFAQYTKQGRALRAVADDHQAALSVGISLNFIWVMVWSIAGFVALVAGIMWGAKSGVQFSLSLIALKALPVLMLGGFTSIPGAIVGGLIIGVGEKLFEFYIGRRSSAARPRTGSPMCWRWSSSSSGRRACSARRSSRGCPDVLPRGRRLQDESYAADSQTFPIKFDRYRYYAVLAVALAVVPFVINDYWVNAVLLPFLIYAIAAIGLNILTGYCGQVSLGTGGFMAVGAYACLQADDRPFPGVDIFFHCGHPVGRDHRHGGRAVRPAVSCGSRGSTWRWPRWRRSSSSSGSSTRCRGSTTTRPRARSARRTHEVFG
jgi:hypothetical protein